MNIVLAADLQTYFSPAQNITTFGQLVTTILTNVFVLAGIVALFILVIGGITMIMGGGGDSKKLEQGKQAITYAILGLIVIATSTWIVQILGEILGFNPLDTGF